MDEYDDLRRILQGSGTVEPDRRRTRMILSRARKQVAQRDTITFLLVKIWAALARMLAPFFAAFGEKQAQLLQTRTDVQFNAHREEPR